MLRRDPRGLTTLKFWHEFVALSLVCLDILMNRDLGK